MTPDLAKAAMVFLARTDLKGNEVPVFMQIVHALEVAANTPPAAPPVTPPEPASRAKRGAAV